jgi:hypothetical protein
MRTNTHFILELALFEGAAVAWAAWEFWSVRPNKKPKADAPAQAASASEEDPGHLER